MQSKNPAKPHLFNGCFKTSREAPPEYSPQRKLWVIAGKRVSPEGEKSLCASVVIEACFSSSIIH
jgi:hypothetical protein